MGDPRQFWKERVGVLRTGASSPAAGPGRASHRAATTGAPGPPASRAESSIPLATAVPSPGQPENGLDESTLSGLLGALPAGSSEFSRAIGKTLWRNPAAEDVARLARLVASWRDLPNEVLRDAATGTISLRLRVEKLSFRGPAADVDPDTWATRGAECLRIASEAERIATRLASFENRAGAETARAALELLPAPSDLRAHSALCSETASLIETALIGGRTGLWRPIAAADALLHAIEEGSLGGDDLRDLEIFAACSAAQRDIEAGGRDGLLRSRRLLAIIAGAQARNGAGGITTTGVDAATIRRRAWIRLLSDTRVRIDEALTRPRLSGGTTLPPDPSAGRASAETGEARNVALLAHLRHVRAEARIAARAPRTDGTSTPPRS